MPPINNPVQQKQNNSVNTQNIKPPSTNQSPPKPASQATYLPSSKI